MPNIERITLFKVPDQANIPTVLEAYKKLQADQKKNGEPYIISMQAYKLYEDPRSAGYTVAAKCVFASLEDMKFYDEECAAHGALKSTIKTILAGPPQTIYMDVE